MNLANCRICSKKILVLALEAVMFERAINYITVPNKMSYVFNVHIGKAIALFTEDQNFTMSQLQ